MEIEKIKEKTLAQVTKTAIYNYIKSLDFEKSNKLPTEMEFSKSLGVSRITVRNALNELATEGVVFRRQGKGTFFNREALQMNVPLIPARDLRDVIKESGYKVSLKVVKYEIRVANESEVIKLRMNEGERILYTEKVFYANKNPAFFCIDKIKEGSFKEPVTKEDLEESIYNYIESNTERSIVWDKVEFSTVLKDDNELLSKYFADERVKSLLKCKIVRYDSDDCPVILSSEFINTDLIRYNLIRQKK